MNVSLDDGSNVLANILDQTLDCIFTFDAQNLAFTYVNEGAIQQVGYTRDELLAMTPLDIKPTYTAESFTSLLDEIPKGEKVIFQTVHRHKNGQDIPVEIFLQRVEVEGQRPSYIAIVRDITERIKNEKELVESEELFRTLSTNAVVGIFKLDELGQVTYMNQRCCELTGLSFDDAAGHGWLAAIHPDDNELVVEHFTSLVERNSEFNIDYRFVHADQSELWVAGHANPLFNTAGETIGFIGTLQDLTERRNIEKQTAMMDRKLRETQKLESLGLLAGGIAHDFNNLLTGIMGSASLASMELPQGSPIQNHLVRIDEGSVRAADLCKQLLAYSGSGRFVITNLSLNEVIEESEHLLNVSISKKAVLSFELFKGLPAIEADATQIRQILMNLVINASEAIDDVSGVINVATGLTRVDRAYLASTIDADDLEEGTYAYIEVSDTGSGMPENVTAQIFDPFFTTKFTGRGLGLAAAMGIVRSHKGTIKVYSEEGQGTTFKMLFPVVDGEIESISKAAHESTVTQGSGRVLIVDDEESIRSTAAFMVERMGFGFALAEDGREAVELVKSDPTGFDLVLMDLTMPHMNGEQAFGEMRRINKELPIVLMSGFSQETALSRFKGKGLAGFLEKPFHVNTLSEVLKKIL